MGYTSMSFVAFEQPSLSKWQQLNTNDASFNDGSGLPTANSNSATVTTSEATTSTSYADLSTITDTVTVTVGASGKALVIITANLYTTTAGGYAFVSFAASGANTIATSDSRALLNKTGSGSEELGASWMYLAKGLTPGSTTFKLKYKVSAGTGNFQNRYISVITL